MYPLILIILFIIGISVYLFAPIEEMRTKAKHAIEQRNDLYDPVKETFGTMMTKMAKTKDEEEPDSIEDESKKPTQSESEPEEKTPEEITRPPQPDPKSSQ